MRGPHLLLTGDFWHAEFRGLVQDLRLPVTLVGLDQVEAQLADLDEVSALVVAESRRGQIPRATLVAIRDRHPLLPMVLLLGSWCEGETRSGDPVPGVARVYWHQWRGEFRWFLDQLAAGKVADWQLPRTSTLADRAERLREISIWEGDSMVGIGSWTADGYQMMADAVAALGGKPVWLDQHPPRREGEWRALILVGNSWTECLEERLKELRRDWDGCPLLLVLNFPRIDERRRARAAGATEVLGKPFSLTELAGVLESLPPSILSASCR